MKDLGNIINDNRVAQLNGFMARFRQAMKYLPSGFTVDNLGNIVRRTSGYAVAIRSFDNLGDLSQYFEYTEEVSVYAGYWKDVSGVEYFEVVRIVEDYLDALTIAVAKKQKAFYDFYNQRDIYLQSSNY